MLWRTRASLLPSSSVLQPAATADLTSAARSQRWAGSAGQPAAALGVPRSRPVTPAYRRARVRPARALLTG